MCKLASWVEVDIKDKKVIYFLDKNKLRGKEGNELKKYLGSKYDNDVVGHGAIRYYYPELKGIGKDREVNDFSNPKRFPKIIADSIKAGDFDCFFDSRLVNMLNDKGREEYLKIEQPAYEEYLKTIRSTFWKIFKDKNNRKKVWK